MELYRQCSRTINHVDTDVLYFRKVLKHFKCFHVGISGQPNKKMQKNKKLAEQLKSFGRDSACSGCFNPKPFADVCITMLVNVDN